MDKRSRFWVSEGAIAVWLIFRGAIAVCGEWKGDRWLVDFLEGRSLFVGDGKAIAGWLIFRGAIAEGCLLDSIEHSNHDTPFPL